MEKITEFQNYIIQYWQVSPMWLKWGIIAVMLILLFNLIGVSIKIGK